ncbi:MAG: flavin monoamine oxidase family protein [Gaiellaceae bacterium]
MNGNYDAVVVGGGVGGAYAAWRLATGTVSGTSPIPQDPADRSIALVELSDRIGGRLESLVPPEMVNLRAEFGGMGYTSNDTLVNELVELFSLPFEPFPRGGASNLLYLRGERFTNAQANDPTTFTPPYQLPAADKGVDPRKLVPNAIEKAFPGCSTWTQEQWDQATSKPFNGRSLNDMGFWNFLLLIMTNEELSYARDAYGHFFEVANWNCAQALPWFMLDGNATYSTLTDGYDRLPLTLAQKFAEAGGQTFMSTPVLSVQQGSSGMEVVAEGGQTFLASVVVLALPRRALELLDAPVLTAARQLVTSVTGQPVMKVFCCYEQPWWSTLGIAQGSSATDLPLGQVWYFGPDSATNPNSLLLATYNDTVNPTYWEGIAFGPRFSSGEGGDPHWAGQSTSAYMVEELQRQLEEVHGVTPPEPYSAAWMDWSADPYGGAFNTWNVGVDVQTVANKILQPGSPVPLYVCGEAYSHDQGWVEGALDTAEEVVEMLGVQPPDGGSFRSS